MNNYLNSPLPNGAFQGQRDQNANDHNMILKNTYWQELACYNHGQGAELESTEKQLQLSGQSRT